jgi:hypothetical protein
MTVRKAPGKHLIATLNRSLKEGTEWTEAERVTLDLIEEAADTVAVLTRRRAGRRCRRVT